MEKVSLQVTPKHPHQSNGYAAKRLLPERAWSKELTDAMKWNVRVRPPPVITAPVIATLPPAPTPSGNTNGLWKMQEDLDRDRTDIGIVAEVCEEPEVKNYADMMNDNQTWVQRRLGARLKHLELLKHHRVYEVEKLPAGERLMSYRWVDSDDFTNAKSRFTGRGYEQALTGSETFYAATPKEATLRMLLIYAEVNGLSVLVGDAAQAFLQAPLREEHPIFVKPAEEAEEAPGMVWRLLKTLPGLKGGPAAWGDYSSEVLAKQYELQPTKHEPCLYHRTAGDVHVLRHMDDFLIVGARSALQPMAESMKDSLLLRGVTWLEKPGDTVQFLGRRITKREGGFDLSVSKALADLIVGDAGSLGSRTCGVPGSKDATRDLTPVGSRDHSYYRTQTGRLIFYCQYRPDMQYTIGQLARAMSAPCTCHMVALKRCIRYLASTLHRILALRPQRGPLTLVADSDADWAGIHDRKSVSSGMLYMSGALFLSFSRTQASHSLSSCESELYALGSTCSEMLWASGLVKETFGQSVVPLVQGDSTSALALASRAGMGRLKHVEIRLLALQDWCSSGRIALTQVHTDDNTADLGTKYLSVHRTLFLSEQIGLRAPDA